MNIALWVLQVFGALVYLASGVMKVFLFDTVTADVPSFGALPKQVWATLGLIELVCAVALVLPAVLQWRPSLVAVAATILAIESLVFIWVHLHYRVRLIRFGGHVPKGGYDVPNGQDSKWPAPAPAVL